MDETKWGILFVDGDQKDREAMEKAFGSEYSIKTCQDGIEALNIMRKEGDRFPLLIAGQRVKGIEGIELCEKVAAIRPQTLRMVLTGFTQTTPLLLDAINRGVVHDYIVKPWKQEDLKTLLDKARRDYADKFAKRQELKIQAAKIKSLESEIKQIYDSEAIIGESSGLKPIMEIIKKVAPTDSTVLILGETGTGKELLARSIHDRSPRRGGPFVPVHCASLVKNLLEAELFGYEKGAFTGAAQTHLGRFEIANGGTIFLDEIGELSEEIQVKLLRVLQEREIHRVGSNRPMPVNVRVLAATHRNLEKMVAEGAFREDLFYRLNVISLKVPPLRERREDIPALASHFFRKFCRESFKNLGLSPDSVEYLKRYDWPGNIRELQNIIERAVILGEGPTIDPEDMNLNIDQTLRADKVDLGKMAREAASLKSQLRDDEMKQLSEILVRARGNVSEASRLLGIPRTTLFHRLRKHHLI